MEGLGDRKTGRQDDSSEDSEQSQRKHTERSLQQNSDQAIWASTVMHMFLQNPCNAHGVFSLSQCLICMYEKKAENPDI